MDKLLEKFILDTILDDKKIKDKINKKQKVFDFEINMKKRGAELETKISGNSIGALIGLKTILNQLQEQLDIDDDDLEIMMKTTLIKNVEREDF